MSNLVVFYDHSSMLGAPTVSKSRPYGNSAILSDIAEIVGIKEPDWESGEKWSDDDRSRARPVRSNEAGYCLSTTGK